MNWGENTCAIGIDLDGNKDVLGMWISENESAKFWLSVLNELKTTDEALLKMLYLSTMDVIRKWTGRVQNWGQMLHQLSVFFSDRVGQHLR